MSGAKKANQKEKKGGGGHNTTGGENWRVGGEDFLLEKSDVGKS